MKLSNVQFKTSVRFGSMPEEYIDMGMRQHSARYDVWLDRTSREVRVTIKQAGTTRDVIVPYENVAAYVEDLPVVRVSAPIVINKSKPGKQQGGTAD